MTDTEKLPLKTKLAFGIGATGEWVYLGMFNTFIGIFYNQALGLPNALIGAAVLVALIGDAISDPTVGVISDRWRSRWGRRHPFLFAAPLPLALSLWFVFNPPDMLTARDGAEFELSVWFLFIWLTLWTTLSRFCVTLYTIPHLALGGEIVRSQYERSQLFSINAMFSYASGAIFGFGAWTMLSGTTENADGVAVANHLVADSYVPLSIVTCLVIFFCVLLCAVGTLSRGRLLSEPVENSERMGLRLLFSKVLGTLKNRNYAMLLLGFLFFMISSSLFETFNVFVNTYFWELAAEQIRWIGLAALPGIIVGVSAAPRLMRRFDRKPVLTAAVVGLVIFAQLVIDLRLLGLMPQNDSPYLLPALIANSFCFAMTLGMAGVAVLSMIADVIDENELATGLREEGLFYSARAFFAKMANSAGHFVAGVMLDWFVRMPVDAIPGELDADVILRLGLAAGPIMAIAGAVSVIFYSRYGLTRDRHTEILALLEERRRAPS